MTTRGFIVFLFCALGAAVVYWLFIRRPPLAPAPVPEDALTTLINKAPDILAAIQSYRSSAGGGAATGSEALDPAFLDEIGSMA